MIDLALKFLAGELNAYLSARTGAAVGGLAFGRLVDDSGKVAIKDQSLGGALINIDEERVLKSHLPATALINGRQVTLEPELKLNLTLVIAAHFTTYEIALRQLSWVLAFFQSHAGFTRDRYPALDPRIERCTVELQSLTFEQLNQMWAVIGGKHLPSVVYRLRLVVVQDVEPTAIGMPVSEIDAQLDGL